MDRAGHCWPRYRPIFRAQRLNNRHAICPTTYQDKAMTDQSEATLQNLYQITGNVADINTVLIERSELRRLQAECAELEAQLYAIGAGGQQ